MAVKSGFFNSIAGDRLYDAEDVNSFFDGVIVDGVLSTIEDTLVVSATTGMQVSAGAGKAWFLKSWLINTADKVLTLSTSHVSYDRIDIIALDFDKSNEVRDNDIIVIEGTPAASPVPPTLLDTDTHLQIPLCYILVGTGVTEIIQGNITNKVGTSECPFSQGITDLIINVDDITIEIVLNDLQVKDSGISTAKIAPDAVTNAKIATGAVDTDELATDAVTNAKIASGAVDTDELVADAVTNAKIASGAVDTDELATYAVTAIKLNVDSVTTAKIAAGAVTTDELGASAVNAARIATGAVETAKLAANSVDDTKVGDRVPQLYRRQGGSVTDWETPGITTYTPGAVRMQVGTVSETGLPASSGLVDITFPTIYSAHPLAFVTPRGSGAYSSITASVSYLSRTGFTIFWETNDGTTISSSLYFNWLAIGPE